MSKEYLEALKRVKYNSSKEVVEEFDIIEKGLQRLKSIDNAKPSEALECLENWYNTQSPRTKMYEYELHYRAIKQSLLKTQEQEKENEILKEIIKSFFVKGCPLHQYVDKEFGLIIEVDSDCSIMRLGEYKGIDLDKKLKEVLNND